jgi:hypothetical protein
LLRIELRREVTRGPADGSFTRGIKTWSVGHPQNIGSGGIRGRAGSIQRLGWLVGAWG